MFETQITALNAIREEVHTTLYDGRMRTRPFYWNGDKKRFTATLGGMCLDENEKKAFKAIFSKHGLKMKYQEGRNEVSIWIAVDDPGLEKGGKL
jgi:hypothetical protein